VVHLANVKNNQRRFAPTPAHITGITGPLHRNTHDALRGDYQQMLKDGLLLEDAESFDLLMVKCKKIQEQVKRLSAIEDKT